jgi:hypothetical protein
MNIKNIKGIFLSLGLLSFMLLPNDTYAIDMGVLQEQCADIGFKIKTPANGKCVLRLIKGVNAKKKADEAQREAYVKEQEQLASAKQADEAQRQAKVLQTLEAPAISTETPIETTETGNSFGDTVGSIASGTLMFLLKVAPAIAGAALQSNTTSTQNNLSRTMTCTKAPSYYNGNTGSISTCN